MKRKSILISAVVILSFNAAAQKNLSIVSGPMLAHTELRTTNIWVQFKNSITSASIFLKEKNKSQRQKLAQSVQLKGGEFNTVTFTLSALDPGKTYTYFLSLNKGKSFIDSGEVTTQSLWQWRSPAPDFSFLTGSCVYINQAEYDRPGKPYGLDSSIFESMAKEKSSFFLWLGDNWYTRESDYYSNWGLHYRPSKERSLPVLQGLLKAMPQYAIWDDHDYGPNDAGESYILKKTSRDVFMQFWGNPSYGMDNQGTYSQFTCNDVDVFLMDDRWWRSADKLPDSVNALPNENKKMFGDVQMEWIKNSLLLSNTNTNISFRIIATGSQVLNPLSPYDCLRHYPVEFNELLRFINDQKINGLIFLTGDRHHSEIIKTERTGSYPLYDITVSPLTSTVATTSGVEKNNPHRIGPEIDEQNYARFSFTGEKKERKLTIDFLGLKGNALRQWSVFLKDISN